MAHVNERGFDCILCHNTPEGPGGDAHYDFVAPADVILSVSDTLVGPQGSYDFENRTCSNVYCHDLGIENFTAAVPVWDSSTSVYCGSCHHAPSASLPEDLNLDGQVDPIDLTLFSLGWSATGPKGVPFPDLNQDGEVNANDLLQIIAQWHKVVEAEALALGGSHPTHFDTVRGPGIQTCTVCHPNNDPEHSVIDRVVRFADGMDLENTTVCNNCHGVTAQTKPTWGGTVQCRDCHKPENPGNSMADGSGLFAPAIRDNFWSAGHGLSSSETYAHTANPGAGFEDCLACHEQRPVIGRHISHTVGDEKRLRNLPDDGLLHTIRSTELCLDCHRPGQLTAGMLGYDASAEADIHSTAVTGHYGTIQSASNAFPAYGNQSNLEQSPGYQCVDCHNPHGTDNLAMIKEEIDGKVGGVSNPQPVVLMETSLDWVNGTNGVCEACHSEGGLPHPDSYHPGNHHLDSDCRICHLNHESSFQPEVKGCNQCHGGEAGAGPDGANYPDTARSHPKHVLDLDLDCILCHNTPEGPGGQGHFDYIPPADIALLTTDRRIGAIASYDSTDRTCNVYCHNPTGGEPPAPKPEWGEPTTVFCGSCHAVTANTLETGSHAAHFDLARGPGLADCLSCHPDNSANHSPIDGVVTFHDGKDLLETNACNPCHGVTASTKPDWGGEVGCMECHNSSNPANSKADGTGINAPVLSDLFWTAGHGLSVTETFTFTGSHGPGFSNCLACHEKFPAEGRHISHIPGDESRLRAVPEDNQDFTLKTTELCMDCHMPGQNVAGTLGFDATSEADIHSTAVSGHFGSSESAPGAFPAYGDQSDLTVYPGYQCVDCHNPHGTTNLAMIREEIDGKIGGESNPQSVTFTEQDPRWALGGEGICESCHRPGERVHPDTAHPGNHNLQDDGRGDCRVCHHNHQSSFQPDPVNCSLCHGDQVSSAPVDVAYPNQDNAHTLHVRALGLQCSLCHNTPEGAGGNGHFDFLEPADVVLDTTHPLIGLGAGFDPATLTCSNVYCHNPAGGNATPPPPVWDNPESVFCGSCHSIDLTKDLSDSHKVHADTLRGPGLTDCLTCHPNNSLSHTPIDGIVEFADGHDLLSTETCNHCHGVTAATKPSWGEAVGCVECHKANNPANSRADGSGIFAPERTTLFPIKGHGLASTENYALTENSGAGLPNCVPCHEDRPTHGQHITHLKGDEKRLRDIPRDSLAFTSRSTEQCLDCHIPGREELGHLGVDASAEAMIHSSAVTGHYGTLDLAPEAFPAYGNDGDFETNPGFQCADCHNPHGTLNLAMIRTEIDGRLGGISNPSAVNLTESEPLWANGVDGVCEACHTPSGLPHPDTNHAGNHNLGSDCRACHYNHGNSFRPLSGSGSCLTCHSSPQNGRRAVTGEFGRPSHHVIGSVTDSQCVVCHDQSAHMAGTVRLIDYDTPGSSISFSDASSAEAFCLGCHDTDGADGNFVPFSEGGVALDIASTWGASAHKTAGQTCLDCHENNHGSEKRRLLSPADVPATVPTLTEEQEGFCYTCHGAGGPASKNVEAEFALLSHHDVAHSDQSANGGSIECVDCHNPHAGDHQHPLIDPDEPHSVWTGDQVDFCLRCHDGVPPAGVVFPSTSPGTGYDKSRFVVSKHGLSGAVGCGDCHKSHGSSWDSLKTHRYEQSDQVTYSNGGPQYLLCWQCHMENAVVGNEAENAFDSRHDKHVKEQRAACIECHDPHAGYDAGEDGLISFVYPDKKGWDFDLNVGGTTYNLSTAFQDTGTNRGSCYLECHSERHNPKSYIGQEANTLKPSGLFSGFLHGDRQGPGGPAPPP